MLLGRSTAGLQPSVMGQQRAMSLGTEGRRVAGPLGEKITEKYSKDLGPREDVKSSLHFCICGVCIRRGKEAVPLPITAAVGPMWLLRI